MKRLNRMFDKATQPPEGDRFRFYDEYMHRQENDDLGGLYRWAGKTLGWWRLKIAVEIKSLEKEFEGTDAIKARDQSHFRRFIDGIEDRSWSKSHPSIDAWCQREFGWDQSIMARTIPELLATQYDNRGYCECPNCKCRFSIPVDACPSSLCENHETKESAQTDDSNENHWEEQQIELFIREYEQREADGSLDGIHAWAQATLGWSRFKVNWIVKIWTWKPQNLDEIADHDERSSRKFVEGLERESWQEKYQTIHAWTSTEFGWSEVEAETAVTEWLKMELEDYGCCHCPQCDMELILPMIFSGEKSE